MINTLSIVVDGKEYVYSSPFLPWRMPIGDGPGCAVWGADPIEEERDRPLAGVSIRTALARAVSAWTRDQNRRWNAFLLSMEEGERNRFKAALRAHTRNNILKILGANSDRQVEMKEGGR